ncbi:MAG: dephospho-CoA kinase [Calditrichaeota bacterium]|nr:dephospho-CoA kinase [Calditrichota bacterium]
MKNQAIKPSVKVYRNYFLPRIHKIRIIILMDKINKKSLIVGLTGIPGSGKSEVARMLAQRGAIIVDVDLAGRWAVEENESVREQIRRTFGDAVFIGDELDRRKLGALIFADKNMRDELNRIVHPAMLQRVDDLINESSKTANAPYIVVDAALIFELGLDKKVDVTVTVSSPIETCIKRAMQRDGLDREEVMQRIKSQLPQEEKVKRADYVLRNDGDRVNLEKEVGKLHDWLLEWPK